MAAADLEKTSSKRGMFAISVKPAPKRAAYNLSNSFLETPLGNRVS